MGLYNRLRRVAALSLALAALVLGSAAGISCAPPKMGAQAAPPVGWQIGNLAPDFTLLDLEGNPVSLTDFRGRPVMVNFWATWCPSCRVEMPFLQQVYDERERSDRGLVLLAIDIGESPAKVREFMDSNRLSLPVLFDFTGGTSDDYGVSAIPTTFFVDVNGVIRQKMVGAFPNVRSIETRLSSIMP